MSAVYELGMEIIERNLESNMAIGSSAKDDAVNENGDVVKKQQERRQSWLQCQRELLESKTS